MDAKVLKELKKLKTIYQVTKDVTVGDDLKLKIRLLTSEEESNTHAYSTNTDKGLAYLFTIKRETLCNAIVGLNGSDLPDFIEDGSEKLQKHVWLRKNIISGWSQMLVDVVWEHYRLLMEELENKLNIIYQPEVDPEINKEVASEKTSEVTKNDSK